MLQPEKGPEGQKEHTPTMDEGTWQEIKEELAVAKKEGDISNPKNCKVDEVKISQEDTIDSNRDTLEKMIDMTFLLLGVEKHDTITKKIIAALEKSGVKTADFVEKSGANLWSVENGKIILKFAEPGKSTRVVATVKMYPQEAYFPTSHETVRTVKYASGVGHTGEGSIGVDEEKFAEATKEEKESVLEKQQKRKKTVDVLTGQVDATEFKQEKRSEDWYKDKILQADALLTIYETNPSRFDPDTATWIKENETVLTHLADQQSIHDLTAEEYSSLTRTFEKEHPQEKVFGSRGVYNMLLAFERALNAYHLTSDNLDGLVKNEKIQIVLQIGKKAEASAYRASASYRRKEDKFVPSATVPPEVLIPKDKKAIDTAPTAPNIAPQPPYSPQRGERKPEAE